MPLRPLPFREVKRKLEAAGFTEESQRGSHVKFVKRAGGEVRTATVPRHRESPVGSGGSDEQELQTVQAYKCPSCEALHEEEDEARNCCGGVE